MSNTQLTIENTPGSTRSFERTEHRERARKNWDWLKAHWSDPLPGANGKFVAVANQEAFVADTLDAALEWVRSTHPEDTGHIVEFVRPPTGPRIYLGNPC